MVPEKTCTPRLCTHEHTNMIALTLRRYREKKISASFRLFVFSFSDTTCTSESPSCTHDLLVFLTTSVAAHLCPALLSALLKRRLPSLAGNYTHVQIPGKKFHIRGADGGMHDHAHWVREKERKTRCCCRRLCIQQRYIYKKKKISKSFSAFNEITMYHFFPKKKPRW